jgi:hypothetical protein
MLIPRSAFVDDFIRCRYFLLAIFAACSACFVVCIAIRWSLFQFLLDVLVSCVIVEWRQVVIRDNPPQC